MGTTGSSEKVAINSALPDIIARVREYATVPIAVGFGVATREHFNTVADAGADGVVLGSRLVGVIKNSAKGEAPRNVQAFCQALSGRGEPLRTHTASAPPLNNNVPIPPTNIASSDSIDLPARFGQFGGQYVPEALVDCLAELEAAHKSAISDLKFWQEFQSYYGYMNRPSGLYFAENLTKDAGGAKIWLKREDL